MAEKALLVHQLRKVLGGRLILDRLDLEVAPGETMVILGPSGSGKSTLLRCMVGLDRPDAGTVQVLGKDIFATRGQELSDLRQRMGMAFQAGALFGSMTLAKNVEMPLKEFSRLPPSTRRIIARIKLGMVGLEAAMDQYPAQISGGMRKRAALARAMVLDPQILFFDEPSAGLDPITAAGLDRLLIQLKSVFRVAQVVVTHELASAFAIADRVALIHQGRFLVVDTPEAVQASRNPVVRRFLDRQPPETLDGAGEWRRFFEAVAVGDEVG